MQPQQHQQPEGKPQLYRVFQPTFDSVAHDPLDPQKRYHEGIFIETDQTTELGTLFHVTGDIIAKNGMYYEERGPNYHPNESAHLHSNPQIGWVLADDFHSGRISAILKALPTPPKQQGLNFWEMDPRGEMTPYIWTKQDGERYGPDEERPPVFKCNEWTNQYALPALRDAGVLRDMT
ncbi:hypothetical protein AJ79_09429 [Helicocarpus griseus UAMH5409]|uniref:Uncharacterized protein n=1 Tax=Helicocarpus griseus UAMH5409 TaxID=1447875 RepID=A0A2B7WK28_9EURO|nr:hypothetical protein AJ79_09429 [Helicocarpus griseus UAMH5409]